MNTGIKYVPVRTFDAVINGSAPQQSLHNGCKIVVHEDDISRLLSHLCTGNTHGKSNISKLQSRSIIRAVTGDCYRFSKALESLYQNSLILWARSSENL
ncbi:hypothetical protein SNK05_013604 [Fusarium graminearum]